MAATVITPYISHGLSIDDRLKLKCLRPRLLPPLNLHSPLSFLLSSSISRHPIRAIYGDPALFPKANPLKRRGYSIPSSFCLFNTKQCDTQLVLCATVGSHEPHAARTALPEVNDRDLDEFLPCQLPSHPKLYRGELNNGLIYLILPNKVPPNRFEAHMEVHVGSIDEEDDEQGIAHMIEHVAFLGSQKREKLLGTGAQSNAYTDFHHTVFHIHSPTSSKDYDGDLLPYVLDALKEIAFHPKFLSSRVEKERRAILSELQMMNTIDYRLDCQLLQHLHSENKLSKRFPIGLEDQIKKWDVDKIRKFYERWYFPGNATLYIVGDIDDISKTVFQIEVVFGQTGAESEAVFPSSPSAYGAMADFLAPKLLVGLGGSLSNGRSFNSIPVNKVQTYGDLRNVMMKRIYLSALHFRINTRYKSSNPPFISIGLDNSDSGREGCTVTTLTVTAEPKHWQSAIKVAVQEVRRLKEFGVTKGELTFHMDALLKDSEHLAAMIDNVSSVDNLDFIMESDALGHTVMDQRQGHESLATVAGTIKLEEVNSIGAKGETKFTISPSEITAAIKAGLKEPIEAEPELEVPKELISSSQLRELWLERSPSFISLSPETNISKSEACGGVMRLIVGGGRAVESSESRGAVVVGVRTLSEGGRVGNFSREQVELFCVNHLINCSLECTEEFIAMEFRFTLRDNGMRAAFQLLHMVLEHSVWLDDAFDRARQLYLSYYRSIPKSLERSTAHKLMIAMLDGDERFVEPTPKSLQKLTLQSVKDAVMNQFVGNNMEIFLKDTDERACAYIAGPAPNRWGLTVDSSISAGDDIYVDRVYAGVQPNTEELLTEAKGFEKDLQRKLRGHPLFFGITMGLLAEIINSRLFTTVRDSLGLTYDVSFDLKLFDRLNLGWYIISVTSTPGKVHKAVDACKNVLRGLHSNRITQRELDRAKRTLLMRHEAEIKSNVYWLGLLAHLQASSVPGKDISCIKDLTLLYEAAEIEDVYLSYDQLKVDEDSLYSCIGIAGAHDDEEDRLKDWYGFTFSCWDNPKYGIAMTTQS
ncbi:hypothetical protein F8388_015230 [Cannabis sativa]|uniref:Uncharacterized protein n=1 Tax=Cannabis sativa TaxID=3483 RepID=A0A7J6EAU9_CANSA|nr:hypothetical protein F8388_015230 [Cannabis sativa]